MCTAEGCDSSQLPPPGEGWCRRRLEIELERWEAKWPSMAQRKPYKDLLAEVRSLQPPQA